VFAAATGISVDDVLTAALGIIVASLIVGIAASFVHLFRDRNKGIKDDAADMSRIARFFFDTPKDPRTNAPFQEGWTTKIDRAQKQQGEKLAVVEIKVNGVDSKLDRVLAEITSDNNGGHNLEGKITRAVTAAEKTADLVEEQRRNGE
jgi:hypothetical protein